MKTDSLTPKLSAFIANGARFAIYYSLGAQGSILMQEGETLSQAFTRASLEEFEKARRALSRAERFQVFADQAAYEAERVEIRQTTGEGVSR